MSAWGVFLDRDGTINEEAGLIADPARLRPIAGAAAAIKRLKAAGAAVAVVTNQSVVARGLIDERGLERVHERLRELLAAEGAAVDMILYCPHHPETHHPEANDPRYRRDCSCRKPKPGLLLEAAASAGLSPAACYMVGDSTRDIAAGIAAGCRATVLLETGFAGKDGECPDAASDVTVADLAAAADWILERQSAA